MEGTRLDLDAPLLSVRRIASAAPAAQPPISPPTFEEEPGRRGIPTIPVYRPELKSGPLGIPGMVPFLWEQSAGRPKDGEEPTARPAAIVARTALETKRDEEEEDEAFTDVGSCFMSCSVSATADRAGYSGGFLPDPPLRDFVMGRFLHAAQVIASTSPQSILRNAGERQQRRTPRTTTAGVGEDEHVWGEVYEHKLRQAGRKLEEEGSKRASDSNRFSFWSDSPTAEESSSWRRSTGGGHSPSPVLDDVQGKALAGDPEHQHGGIRQGGEAEDVLLHRCSPPCLPTEEIACADATPKIMENANLEDEAVDSDDRGGSRKATDDPPATNHLPPPLPQSPSDSWLRRTLPTTATKGSTSLTFLGIQPGWKKHRVGASSTNITRGDIGKDRVWAIPRVGE